jgi:phosphopantothenoylcysteine decarboxylase/phosphopantothenate--cysteine ligase
VTSLTLGITGGIAAYKIPDLIRQFRKTGISVQCIVTRNALDFVTPLTLQVVSETPVITPDSLYTDGIAHLESIRHSAIFVVAPATANFIGKAAAGIADDPLLSAFLAYTGPKLIIPAMHDTMWANPACQRNIDTLKSWGVEFLGPDVGDLACGDNGPGRMIDPALIILKLQLIILKTPSLNGKKVLIGLGGTREAIDSVRVITNLSSGRLGMTLSHAFALSGAEVVAVSTVPISANPHISKVIPVNTSSELQSAIETEWPSADLLIMPAAVSDFRPATPSYEKIKRQGQFTLELIPTDDILKTLTRHRPNQKMIGFCLSDSHELTQVATEKLYRKNLDAIVANHPDQFGADRRNFEVITATDATPYRDRSLVEMAAILVTLADSLLGPH